MDKEQKKLLLVAVSVGVFLLITITAAILILTPKVNTEETAFSSSYPVSTGISQPADNVNNPIQPAAVNPSQIIEPAPLTANETDHLTIQVQKPTTAAVPDNPDLTPSQPARQAAATAPVKPAATPTAIQPASKPATTTRAASSTRTTNDYWIQTGAYSAMVNAEDIRELLASKGFTSIIETRMIEGRNLYRVRLGPYTSEKEAKYWLSLVQLIDGFNDSQVRQTVRQQ